jgi:hypothetical protein
METKIIKKIFQTAKAIARDLSLFRGPICEYPPLFLWNKLKDANIASCVPNVLDYEGREKYKIAHIEDDNLNIDELHKKRISNTEAIKVLYFLSRNGALLPNSKNNIEAGLVFTKFREKLYKEIKKIIY